MKPTTYSQALLEARTNLTDPSSTVPTGWPTVDQLLGGGLKQGRQAFIFGRTEVGKTTLALNIAAYAASRGHHVAVASMEMTKDEVALRALSAHYDQPEEVITKQLVDDGLGALDYIDRAVEELRLLSIDDSSRPDWDELHAWVQGLENVVGVRPGLVIIDHLKLMKRYGYPRGDTERVQQLAEDGKAFAKDTGVATLVIHQASRAREDSKTGEKNHGDIPLTMEDMMHGGEQDADVIFGAFRPERNPKLSELERAAEFGHTYLQVLKNRFGGSCLEGVALQWKRPSMRIEEQNG